MANKKKEGFTKEPNWFLEEIMKQNLSGVDRRLLDVIKRKTWGFRGAGKENGALISISTFEEMTGLDRRYVHRRLKALEDRGLINIDRSSYILAYSLQADTSQWKPLDKNTTVKALDKKTIPVGQEYNGSVGLKYTHKRKERKELKETGNGYSLEFENFWKEYPRKEGKATAYRKWNSRIKDGFPPEALIKAAELYSSQMQTEGRQRKHIKLASTFLGPDLHFKELLEHSEEIQREGDPYWYLGGNQ